MTGSPDAGPLDAEQLQAQRSQGLLLGFVMLWSEVFMAHHGVELDEEGQDKRMQRLMEGAALIFFHRERLRELVTEDTYAKIAEAADFEGLEAMRQLVEEQGVEAGARYMMQRSIDRANAG